MMYALEGAMPPATPSSGFRLHRHTSVCDTTPSCECLYFSTSVADVVSCLRVLFLFLNPGELNTASLRDFGVDRGHSAASSVTGTLFMFMCGSESIL